ncbi:hypothetical protein DXG01_005981 [Tephrocybe rancida]|nr:hypothetical protein DXG01_005981 [Tephrocybe rancida]
MPSPHWFTPDQGTFLDAHMSTYREHMANGNYTPFWASLNEEWENDYPERLVLYPNLPLSVALDAEQIRLLGLAIEKRQKQLISWFRWRTQKKARKAEKKKAKKLDKIILGSRSRLPQLTEIYSDLYYDERIAPTVKERTPMGANPTERLTIVKSVTRDLWNAEENAVVQRVHARLAELKVKKEERKDVLMPSPAEISEYVALQKLFVYLMQIPRRTLDNLPAFMGRFLEYLHVNTGWNFSCVMGGPDPTLDPIDIRVCSFHVGETPGGKGFAEWYQGFDKTVMRPYTDFSYAAFPECVSGGLPSPAISIPPPTVSGSPKKSRRKRRRKGSGTEDNDGKEDNVEESKSSQTLLAIDFLGLQGATNTLSTNIERSLVSGDMMLGNASLSSTTAQEDPISFESSNVWAGRDGPGEFMSLLYSLNGHSADNYQPPENVNVGGFDFGLGYSFDLGLVPSSMSNTAPGLSTPNALPNPPGLQPWMGDTGLFDLSLFSLPVESGGLPASNNSSITQLSTPPLSTPNPSVDLFMPAAVPTVNPTPLLPVTTNTPPLPDPSSPTSTATSLALLPIPNSAPAPPATSPIDVPAPPATRPVEEQGMDTVSTVAVSGPSAVQSRSRRTIIPSTRAEQLNMIGSSDTRRNADGKENVPPILCGLRPPWMDAAHAHLSTRDLGGQWTDCVAAWNRFEEQLQYHHGKGLPGAKDRPEEWSKWTTKSRRSYSDTPVIHDPMEFSLAIVKWWRGIQPKARQLSMTLMPVPLAQCPAKSADNVWATLRKGGPNGMLVMMTLLAWWGQRSGSSTQWQENSHSLWAECVADVRECLNLLTATASSTHSRGRKHAAPEDGQSVKRARSENQDLRNMKRDRG